MTVHVLQAMHLPPCTYRHLSLSHLHSLSFPSTYSPSPPRLGWQLLGVATGKIAGCTERSELEQVYLDSLPAPQPTAVDNVDTQVCALDLSWHPLVVAAQVFSLYLYIYSHAHAHTHTHTYTHTHTPTQHVWSVFGLHSTLCVDGGNEAKGLQKTALGRTCESRLLPIFMLLLLSSCSCSCLLSCRLPCYRHTCSQALPKMV
jgi:hypothetical protein